MQEGDEGIFYLHRLLTVRRHHGNFRDVMNEALLNKKEKCFIKQVESIDEAKLAIVNGKLIPGRFECGHNSQRAQRMGSKISDELRRMRMKLRS